MMQITPKDTTIDPEDSRRIDEIRRLLQTRKHKTFTAKPALRQLADGEVFAWNDNGTLRLGIRHGQKLYTIDLTEVT